MATIDADPQSLAVPCPICHRGVLSRCQGRHGQPVPTHRARIRAGQQHANGGNRG